MKWGKKKYKAAYKTFEEWEQSYKKSQFDEIFIFIQQGLEQQKVIEEKIDLLNYLLTVLREDLKYSLIAEVIYKKRAIDLKHRFIPDFKTQDGEDLNVNRCQTGIIKDISLSDDCVIGVPWAAEQIWKKTSWMLRRPFINDSNHQAVYLPELKVCFVLSGNHSIAVGVVYRKGLIKANECSIIPAFDHLQTDGENWINSHTNEILEPVKDFRIAAMFEIAKMIHQLKMEF